MCVKVRFISDDIFANHLKEKVSFLVILDATVRQETKVVIVHLKFRKMIKALADLEKQLAYLRKLFELLSLIHALYGRVDDFNELLCSYKVWNRSHLSNQFL